MSRTHENANEFNIEIFLECYTNLNIKETKIMKEAAITAVGLEAYKAIVMNDVKFAINRMIGKLIIFK